MSDPDDDRTTVSRAPAPDDAPTTTARVVVVDDEATTITRSVADDDATTITRPTVDDAATTITRADVDDEATTVSRGGVVDERTVVSAGRPEPVDDATQIRGAARSGIDETTTLSDGRGRTRPPSASAPAPGRLSGGRVAFVPGDKVQNYQVRDRTPAIDNVVRTVIPAPVSPARQSRNTVAIEAAVKSRTTHRGIGVVVAIVGVTLLALLVVGGVVAALILL